MTSPGEYERMPKGGGRKRAGDSIALKKKKDKHQNKTIKTRKIMAKVELPKGIIAIHGRMGDYIYRSRKQPDGTYKTFVHYSPKRGRGVVD